ncbi:MAG: TetR family transcriptional regulator [Actinomycetota bacterium]|nr:TetR family transcriptional regulator [Actinomycetota bacterium]
MEEKSRRAEYAEATRRALLDAGFELFAERGYANTSTEEIVRRARVTRGALYHHFSGKAELFRGVVEDLEAKLAQEIMDNAFSLPDPWEVIVRGAEGFLDTCLRPEVQRILLLDAAPVLGWETWREIDARYSLGMTQQALAGAMEAGAIQRFPVDPLAHMLLGALHNAAHYIVESPDPAAARKEAGDTLRRLLEGLRPTSP